MKTFNVFLFLFACTSYSLSGFAQEVKHFKYFMTRFEIPVDSLAKADIVRILSDDGKNVTFVDKYPSGQFRRSGMAASRSKELHKFQPHGEVKAYYPDGKLARITRYNKGRIVGNDSCFYNNGQLMLVRHCTYSVKDYEETEVVYLMEMFTKEGAPIITQGEGTFQTQFPDSLGLFFTKSPDLIAIVEGGVKGGLKQGEWTGNTPIGTYKETYTDGVLKEGTATLNNGEIYTYKTLVVSPQYGKSMNDFWKDLSATSRSKYPYSKESENVTFVIGFYVDESNKMVYPTIEKQSEEGMEARLLNIFSSLKGWKAGRLHGLPFPQRKEMSLVFYQKREGFIRFYR